jgi:phage baseplate assembly protein W
MFVTDLTDLTTNPDLSFDLTSSYSALLEDVRWILLTPKGGLWYDLEYGFGIEDYLASAVTGALLEEVSVRAKNALEQHPAVELAEVTATQPDRDSLELDILIYTRSGEVALIARFSDTTSEVLFANSNT